MLAGYFVAVSDRLGFDIVLLSDRYGTRGAVWWLRTTNLKTGNVLKCAVLAAGDHVSL